MLDLYTLNKFAQTLPVCIMCTTIFFWRLCCNIDKRSWTSCLGSLVTCLGFGTAVEVFKLLAKAVISSCLDKLLWMHRNPEILPSDLDTLMAPFKFFISDKCRKSILTVTDVSTFQSICLTLLTTRISDAHSDSENYRSCDDVVKLDSLSTLELLTIFL